MATQAQTHIVSDKPPLAVGVSPERATKPSPRPKKKLIKRTDSDYSQIPQIPGLAPQAPKIPVLAMAASVAALFFGIVGFAKATGHWDSYVSAAIYQQLVPHADQARHPMPGESQ